MNSNQDTQRLKQEAQKIFELMKKEKKEYIRTLTKGEDDGHCKGIRKRLDPTIRYRIK